MNIDMYFRSLKRAGQLPVAAAVVLFGASGALQSLSAADVTLPAGAALPGSTTLGAPGFTSRLVVAPEGTVLQNTLLRALQQLNGTLQDAEGNLVANTAVPGANANGSYDVDFVDFSTSLFEDPSIQWWGNFPYEIVFPGLPEGAPAEMFASETVAYLRLSAGTYTMGVTAGYDRTDNVDDDGWRLYCGPNPRSFFSPVIAEFQRTGAAFPNATQTRAGNTNEFNVIVPVEGIYPFRLVHWQTKGSTQLEWYLVEAAGTESEFRYLINDPNMGAGLAYRSVESPIATGPAVVEISPLPDSSGVPPTAPVEAIIQDGLSAVNDASIKLYLNNGAVTPQSIQRDGKLLKVKYTPNASRTAADNLIRIEFADAGGVSQTNSWRFSINLSGAPRTLVRGQWDFDQGNLGATVGTALEYLDGPSGLTASGTEFGTTADLGIPDINGVPARVMKVPGDRKKEIGYKMFHGIAPNGGGTLVNQYTLIMDVYVDTTGPGAASLLQVNSPNNTDDGDLFWQGNNFGQGNGGYNGTGAFTAGAWHRIVAAYDEAANPPVVTKYVDGIKQDDWTANQGLDAPRRALRDVAILFGDGDEDERRTMFVNSIQIREGKLSDAEMVLLGGPDAAGIPSELDPVSVAGQWDFEAKNLAATVGKPLEYLDGADGLTKAGTEFGTTTDLGISDIDGVPANVMKVPGDRKKEIGYKMFHGIAPNGGGTLVNQFTLIMDIYVDVSGPGAASLLQINSPDNTDDGDLFWQGGNFGQGNGGYNGTGAFTAGSWHRIAAAYDQAANPPVVTKYVDGIKQDDWTANQGLDAPRRALRDLAILFGDGDEDERRTMYVNSIQIRPGKLSDAQLALLGGPSAAGIPLVLPQSNVTGQWDFDGKSLAATIGKPLEYLDGPDGLTKAGTEFGTTTDLAVADIDGVPADVMKVPGDRKKEIGYKMFHGIAPNGGGTLVNQYTLIMDIFVEASGPGAASLLQINSPDNTDDGDLFWQGSNFGQGNGGYNGTGAFTAGEWHRIAAAYNEAATPPVVTKYVDGIFQDDWTANQGLDAPRRALRNFAILFGDGDEDERRTMWVNSIQIRSGAMSKAELQNLGGPSAAGIPIASSPALTVRSSGGVTKLSWPTWAVGYVLESTTDVNNPDWQPVVGAGANSASVAATDSVRFFRLRKL
ncbi:MAG: hypothetical protein JNN07_17985 [Verrucomicrobiales bacterium]|nr:hypothetical protein [Verrucomicrobiales bacterium]